MLKTSSTNLTDSQGTYFGGVLRTPFTKLWAPFLWNALSQKREPSWSDLIQTDPRNRSTVSTNEKDWPIIDFLELNKTSLFDTRAELLRAVCHTLLDRLPEEELLSTLHRLAKIIKFYSDGQSTPNVSNPEIQWRPALYVGSFEPPPFSLEGEEE